MAIDHGDDRGRHGGERRRAQPARGGRLANATSAADTIVFASSLEGKTLTLTHGELE